MTTLSRPLLLRVGAALQAALLLAIQLADGGGVHRCPDHDAGLGVLAVEAPHPHGHHHEEQGAPGKHHGLCPCLGACCSSTVALGTAGTAMLTAAPVTVAGTSPQLVFLIRTRVPHRLPFSIGPPRPASSSIA